MIKKILIANRGEIACRIIKTCQKLGIVSVAIYSDADKEALFVKQADEAYYLGESEATASYLAIDKIVDIAKKAQVDAIHPGYGFLSENVLFAQKLLENNIRFIGPKTTSLEIMGSKSRAKQCMVDANVPVTPGYHGKDQSFSTLESEAKKIGYPILLKAALGGGGKGMRAVYKEEDFAQALEACKREALKSFADDTILIEKYLENPRHIEVQVFADNHKNIVHLFERDCSIQRRHQKIIEEAPAIKLAAPLKDKLYKAAINAARACDYVGAGTIEFLVDGDELYFMEMNTRLQVEHPVTEMITGVDLVEWQIHVADNGALPLKQEDITYTGHAIEVRLYAEDPDNNFLPQTGTLSFCQWPTASNAIRVDTGIAQHDEVTIYYDPMMAKLIAHAPTREQCINQITQALVDTKITGVKHNRQYLLQTLSQDAFVNGQVDINYTKKHQVKSLPIDPMLLMACALYKKLQQSSGSLWSSKNTWRLNLDNSQKFSFLLNKEPIELLVSTVENCFEVIYNGESTLVKAHLAGHTIELNCAGKRYQYTCAETANTLTVINKLQQIELQHVKSTALSHEEDDGQLSAPMPGNVIAILCKETDNVEKGQSLMIIEAMKMEHTITSPLTGTIDKIFFDVGSKVSEGDKLIAMANT